MLKVFQISAVSSQVAYKAVFYAEKQTCLCTTLSKLYILFICLNVFRQALNNKHLHRKMEKSLTAIGISKEWSKNCLQLPLFRFPFSYSHLSHHIFT